MKLIHKPIIYCMKDNDGHYFVLSKSQPFITGEKARSRNFKNCYVIKCGNYTYSFDSNHEYRIQIFPVPDKWVIRFIKNDKEVNND